MGIVVAVSLSDSHILTVAECKRQTGKAKTWDVQIASPECAATVVIFLVFSAC